MSSATLQKTNLSLLSLFCSANFDTNRIEIAEHEITENFLTLYLEDNHNPASDMEDTVMYKVPISKFADIITENQLNSYAGTLYTNSGRSYQGRVAINDPISWFEEDADRYDRIYTLDLVKNLLLKSSLKG